MSFLQSLERCCPDTIMSCFRTIALKLNKKSSSKKKKDAASIHHLEEQQFQFTPSHKFHVQEESQVKIKDRKQNNNKASQVDENLDVKISLTPIHDRGAESQQRSSLLPRQDQELPSIQNFNFKLNLEPYSQFYELIENKTHNLRQTFQQAHKTMLKKTEKSMATIKQIQTLTGFKLLISYRLPCSYAFYCKMNKNQEIIMNLCGTISSNRIIQVIQPNLAVVQLRFKKFMLLEPRFFRYVKYENSSSSSHWEICVSIKNRPQVQMNQKQCELTSISCLEQDQEGLLANIYLEVDLKSSIKASKVVQRVYQEVANYLDSIYHYAKQYYSEQSA